VLRGPQHSLLLFVGLTAWGDAHAGLRLAGVEVQRRFGDRAAVYVVCPGEEAPELVGNHSSVLLDPGGGCHRRYGARAGCLYLVRPDEHVGFRAQPIDPKALVAYLDRIYQPTSGPASARAEAK
jgi:hypothetical protein